MSEDRIINIETKIAHQELLIEELNKVIYDQQKAIDILEKRITSLSQRLQEFTEDVGPANQKPPHY